ncbi:putative galacturonosyltransferase 10 [Raphanus sativus]|nr:putative galacturonosyltransferase 10 [Raphanus sativus]
MPLLLSNAAASRRPVMVLDSEPIIHDMAVLRYQAQQLHYDSATMIMRLKATIQSFEGHMNSVTEKSAKYAQIAYEEVSKSLYCLGVHLTTEWFQNSELQEKLINIFIDLVN